MHGGTDNPELSNAQRGPGYRQGRSIAMNMLTRRATTHTHTERAADGWVDGWQAARSHPGGDACTCLKLKDLVSACESSSSGSPSGPPASSSPAPPPRTADHVHFAHCTGDRICQGLNAMSADPPAPAPKSRGRGRAFFPFQNGGNR